VTTHYDSANLPATMNGSLGWGVYVAGTLYSSYGQLLQTDLGNTYANYISYDYEYGTNRLTHTWLTREGITGNDVDLRYTYDDAGNTLKVADRPTTTGGQADTQCYAYDGLDRLRSAWTPSSGDCAAPAAASALGGPSPYWTDYAVDGVGNRLGVTQHMASGTTTATYAYPAAGGSQPHAVASVTSTGSSGTSTSTYAYDATGNTTTRAVAGKTTQTLTWDAEGRLATLSEGATSSSYLYTADGDRLVRRQNGSTTVYLPGGQELTLTSAGSVTAMRYYSFGGQNVAVRTGKAGATVSSLVSDPHQTATVAIANTTKVVTQRRLDPYGNQRGTAPTWVGDRGFLNKPVDASGLTSVGARYYDATLGRFLSVDPVMDIGSPEQWAAYSYANNNPVTFSDPSGMLFGWAKSAWNKTRSGCRAATRSRTSWV
jgi:RHS repeat-associated protein